MSHGSRVCPHCGGLNGVQEPVCYRCGKSLPGAVGTALLGAERGFTSDGIPMTKLIFGICVLVYAAALAADGGRIHLDIAGAFRFSTLLRFGFIAPGLEGEPWRLLSAVYLHLGVLHIGLNMLSLLDLGRRLEPLFGSARFFLLYTLTGILGFVVSNWYYGSSIAGTAGASGALFGLAGAEVGVLAGRRNLRWKREFVNSLMYAGIISFILPANGPAHIGGLVSGVGLGFLLTIEPRPRSRNRLMWALSGLCLLATLGSIALSARSPVWREQRLREDRAAEEAERLRLDSE